MMKRQLLLISRILIIVFFFNVDSFGQSIILAESGNSCNINNRTFTKTGTSGGRNIFSGTVYDGSSMFLPATVQYNGTQWELNVTSIGLVAHIVNSSSPNPPVGNNWTDDSGFCGTVSVTSILPVELTNFNANTEGSKTQLTWSTASEYNSYAFDIERSQDGQTYTRVGQVKAQGKASNYSFIDASPLNGMNYYRLKSMDNDQTAEYSKVISVTTKGGKSLKVYPTLVSNGFLTVDTEGGDYAIYNIVGQQVQSGKTAQRLDVSALAKGTYIFRVGTEQAKFVKQ